MSKISTIGCCANENRAARVYIRSKLARGKVYYQIVQGVRSGPRVRQRIVMALGPTPDPAIALEIMKHDLKSLRKKLKHQRGVPPHAKTLVREQERLNIRIGKLKTNIKTLSLILKNRLISTAPK
jgi:hypothetical protein